jgi:hypothetical protein
MNDYDYSVEKKIVTRSKHGKIRIKYIYIYTKKSEKEDYKDENATCHVQNTCDRYCVWLHSGVNGHHDLYRFCLYCFEDI